MKSCHLFALMALAGCSGKPVNVPVDVLVPVSQGCPVDMPEAPAWPVSSLPASAGMADRVKALASENELRKGYEAELTAALSECVKP